VLHSEYTLYYVTKIPIIILMHKCISIPDLTTRFALDKMGWLSMADFYNYRASCIDDLSGKTWILSKEQYYNATYKLKVSHDSSVGLLTVCPPRGPGSIPSHGGLFKGFFPDWSHSANPSWASVAENGSISPQWHQTTCGQRGERPKFNFGQTMADRRKKKKKNKLKPYLSGLCTRPSILQP